MGDDGGGFVKVTLTFLCDNSFVFMKFNLNGSRCINGLDCFWPGCVSRLPHSNLSSELCDVRTRKE